MARTFTAVGLAFGKVLPGEHFLEFLRQRLTQVLQIQQDGKGFQQLQSNDRTEEKEKPWIFRSHGRGQLGRVLNYPTSGDAPRAGKPDSFRARGPTSGESQLLTHPDEVSR